jgi:hypothetical protein
MGFFKRRREPDLFERPPAPVTAPAAGPVQVVLHDAGSNKIQVIKAVREATGLGLKDSKDLVDAAPSTIGGFGDVAAAELVAALEAAGARAGTESSRPWEAQTGDTVAVRQAVWERDGGRCVRCGSQQELQYDHIIPLARGGADTAENLQLLCASCDRAKGDSIG